ncbi:hypothetical protein GCM10027347_60220 [Larkinella harenae]
MEEGYKVYLQTNISFLVSRRRWITVRDKLADYWSDKAKNSHHKDTILIIDDSQDQQVIMQYILRRKFQRMVIVSVYTTEQAKSYLKYCQAEHLQLPKVILLDLYLPKREDGWQLLRFFRNHSGCSKIPVIVMSYSHDQRDAEEAHYWGANGFLTKPRYGQEWSNLFQELGKGFGFDLTHATV